MKTLAPTAIPKCVSVPTISGITGLSITEQAALAFIHERPGCSNRALADRVGFSLRGVEAMLSRLCEAGHIRQIGRGRGRTLELTFAVDRHTECGRAPTGGLARAQNPHTECGHMPKHLPGAGHLVSQTPAVQMVEKVTPRTAAAVADEIAELFDSYAKSKNDHSTGGMRTRTLAFWSGELTKLLAEAREVFPTGCADLLAPVERCRDYWAACCYAGEIVKSQLEYNRLAIRLGRATGEQLAVLYERIQHEQQLGGKVPLLLADVLTEDAANKA